MEGNILVAFGLTLFAGLATGLGSLVVFFQRRPSFKLLCFGLGFSGGVMVFISLYELLPDAGHVINKHYGAAADGKIGEWIAAAAFFGGIALSALIDKLVPDPDNPHEAVSMDDVLRAREGGHPPEAGSEPGHGAGDRRSLARVGLLTAVAIAIHNFPEGMATFVASMTDVSLGLSIAVAVAIHNIPEGVAVAVPVYFATGSKKKAFLHSFASGLAEPVGALLVWLVLMPLINDLVVGVMLAAVAGVMVFISFDELLPTAREYGHGHLEILGVVLGMAVMSLSLLLL